MSRGLIDIHQHVIFDFDDGPRAWEETQAMLEEAVKQGIDRIIATSHAAPGRKHFDYDGYLEKLNRINAFAGEKGWNLRLAPGAEIYYTPQALKKLDDALLPTLAMSRYVLVEFSPAVKHEDLLSALRELANGGYQPILAHVERYGCLQDHFQTLETLRTFDVGIQMNAQTVLRSGSLVGSHFARRLLREDWVDYVATDAHNLSSRPVCLRAAHDFLKKHYGKERALRLTRNNGAAVWEAAERLS